MSRDTTDSERRLSRRQTAIVSLVAVVCILLAGATLVTAQQQTFSDGFEDQNVDGWENVETGIQPDVSSTSVEGDYSLLAETDQLDGQGVQENAAYEWQNGPLLDTAEPFNVVGVTRPQWSTSGAGIRIGIASDDQDAAGQNALLIFDESSSETYLATAAEQSSSSGNVINNDFDGTWVNFRINSPGDGETLRAKVWEHGTSEPGEWQLELDTFDSVEPGRFSVNTGNSLSSAERSLWLDEVTLTGEESPETSDELRLDVPGYLQHNASSSYAVEANQSGTWTDVTGEANVTPSNPDALTFYDNGTVVAGGNKSINERVNVTAAYVGLNATDYTVVATPTVDNLDLLPAWWSVNAVLSDWTMIWILLSTLIATAASRMSTTFAGIGAFVMAMIMGWIMGDVPDGIMVATIFMGLFIGLNLAANIDYSVR